VEEEVPDAIHEVIVVWLAAALRAWAATSGGIVMGSDAKFALGPRHGRKPDVTVYFGASRKPPRRGVIRVPPDLAVEVVSPKARDARRDRLEKHDEYARFGVRYYWLVDPETRIVECNELQVDRYVRSAAASEGKLTVPGFDGLTLDLDDLWRETERLADE
jgi:Uma2 family endonuclease